METIKNEGVWRLYDRQATLLFTDEKQLTRIVGLRMRFAKLARSIIDGPFSRSLTNL